MKVGDLVKRVGSFQRLEKDKVEVIDIGIETFGDKRVRLKYHNKTNIRGGNVIAWESASEWEVDIQRMRDEKLKELGI
jgi:hypothetical protein